MAQKEKIYRQLLEKIKAGKEFSSARRDKDLLHYLVESTLSGKTIKETTIAIDVFDKKSDFDPGQDSSVRSHIYSVRKKLESYYAKEGTRDAYRMIIPKGQYHVTFRKNHSFFPRLNIKISFSLVRVLLTAGFLLLSVYLLLENHRLRQDLKSGISSSVFKTFIGSEMPTLVVVGDYYFYKIKNFDFSDISRLTHVNSDADYDQFVREYPDASNYMQKEDNSYLGQEIAYGLPPLLYELYNVRDRLKIRLASKLNYNDLRENNVIYLGSIKALGIVGNLMSDMQIKYALHPNRILLTDEQSDTTAVYTITSDFPENFRWTDYAIVAKLRGPRNNVILIISTFNSWDSGTAVKQFTDDQILEAIRNQFMSTQKPFPEYFEILLRINGYRRTSLDARPLYFRSRD